MQPAGRQFRSDPRDTDPVIVRSALGSSMVFTPQMNSQRPNSSKIMISTGKPVSIGQGSNLMYSNQRFPSPSMFTPKQTESGSAFTAPRQSAFTATGSNRRGITVKEEPHDKSDRTRMVWHPGTTNDQAYRMSIANSTLGNGSSSIMIPAVLHGQPSIYLDQTLASQLALHQYHPVSTTGHNNVVPMVMNSRHGDVSGGAMTYIASGINQTQPRPSILRKRMQPEVHKNSTQDDVKHDNGQSSSYFHGDPSVYSIRGKMGQETKGANHRGKPPPNDPYTFLDSPRKKPRKQNVVVNEDVFASNVPQDVSNKHDQLQWQTSHIKCEPKIDVQSNQIHYFERKRVSIFMGYKCNNRAAYNHFERYTDIRVKRKKKCETELVTSEVSQINSQGWRLMHLVSQLEDILSIQKDTKAKLCEYKDYFSNLSIDNQEKGDNDESVADILQNNNHCCQSNITQTKQVLSSVDRLLNDHKPKILELMKEVHDKSNIALKITPPHTTPQRLKSESQPSSSSKKPTRKRKT